MPIKDPSRYPANWKSIRLRILDRAWHRCEGSPAYPDCRAVNYQPHPVTGSRVVLTIAHLDHTPENNDPDNLRAWCQRCHLAYDAPHHARSRRETKKKREALLLQGFREVPGFPGFLIDKNGNLLGKNLEPAPIRDNGRGYLSSNVRRGGKQRSLYVHRAVLLAFVGEPCSGQEARHLDGNSHNNKLSNLAWGSRSENISDRTRHGKRMGGSRLTEDLVKEIRERAIKGESYPSIAREIGHPKHVVRLAAIGQTWRQVPGPFAPVSSRNRRRREYNG